MRSRFFRRYIVPLHAVACGCSFNPGTFVETADQPNAYACACQCANPALSLASAPAASGDDAEQLPAGGMLVTGAVLDMTRDPNTGETQQVGVRFPNLGMPRGATILSAQVQFTVSEASDEATNLVFQAEAADDAAVFTATNGDIGARARTAASAAWAVPAWNVPGAAGPDQRTPELAAILQEVVDRPGWAPGNAAALIITGTGLRRGVTFDANPQQAPRLVVEYREPPLSLGLQVCMPAALDPNKDGAGPPTDAQLASDCQNRVENTVRGLTQACGEPSACECDAVAATSRFASACTGDCVENPLAPACANWDHVLGNTTATNAPGDTPVCTVRGPLVVAMMGRDSRCEVSGTATVMAEGETKTTDASGVVELSGTPCPGTSCALGVSYNLDLAPITYDGLFSSATFSDLAAIGGTLPGADVPIDEDGAGVLAPDSADISGQGRRGGDFTALTGLNSAPVDVGAGFTPGATSCGLSGAVIGSADTEVKRCEAGPNANQVCAADADCGVDDDACPDTGCRCLPVPPSDTTVSLDVDGTIVNQPPTADAGADQVVECNRTGGALFALDGRGSADPDGDFAAFRWFLGDRTGPTVGRQPRVEVQQALGAAVTYGLRVYDTYGQAGEDATVAQVRDTTPPSVDCNSPATITPSDAVVAFTATATDVCDDAVAAEVTGFTCYAFAGNGKRIDKTRSCVVRFEGGRLTVVDSGGVGDHIAWTVRAVDDSGNVGHADCEVVVVRKGQ